MISSMRGTLLLVAVSPFVVAFAQPPSPLADPHTPSDGAIRQLLSERVKAIAGQSDDIGMVVGIVGPHERRVISYGHSSRGNAKSLNGDSLFEIGSVGKVFTALLLSDMAERGEVSLLNPAAKYLAPGTKLPEHNGHQISLADLATHTSGLPFMPDTYPVVGDPHEFGPKDVYSFLARYELKRDPGSDWEYSNLDYWLLGEVMAHRTGLSFDQLLKKRIFEPLRMNSTVVEVPDTLKARLAQGHGASLRPALPFYGLSVYSTLGAAAGGVYSSVEDLLTFLSAALGLEPSPLKLSMDNMLKTQRPIDGSQQALGWVAEGVGSAKFFSHDGGTWGYASAVVWDPAAKRGIVVLANQQGSVADIARHLLRPEIPLQTPTLARHTEIPMPPAELAAYVGRYNAEDVGEFNIIRDDDHLTLRLPVDWGLPQFRLHPETTQEFFVTEMPIHVTFETDANRNITRALFYPPRGQHGIQATKEKARP